MFSYEEIQKYSETDIRIYKYTVSNFDKIQYMTIRELANETQVSASTILRFCNKNGFEGYSEFKDALKKRNRFAKPVLANGRFTGAFRLFCKGQFQRL